MKAIRYQVQLLDPTIQQLKQQVGAAAVKKVPANKPTAIAKKYGNPTELAKIQNTTGRIPDMSEAAKATMSRPR
jgi:hypothetical protein